MKNNKKSWDLRIDYALILPVLLLLIIGLGSIYIAISHDHPSQAIRLVSQQGIWALLGVLVAVVVMHFNSKYLWKMTPLFYILGIILMILPLVFYDNQIVASTGAKNWVSYHGKTYFQPSELMKISYILMMARVVTSMQSRLDLDNIKDSFNLIFRLFLVTLPVIILLKLQNDFGTLLVFLAIYAGVIFVSGIPWKIIVPVALTVILLGGGILYLTTVDWGRSFLMSIGFEKYQLQRIDAWFHPFESAQSITYQQAQGQISIGIGGLLGYGFNVATIPVPVRESDMIFTVIAENFGFVGGTLLILLYFFLIYQMLRATYKSNNQFYTYISTGIIMMILFHVFENIGATIGVLPLTGIPLPFISQGGSSLISNLIGVGLVMSMTFNQTDESIDIPVEADASGKKIYRRSRISK
ncbi:FtsW/RodA/SpoVE family cell cycle protein [Streptococcaceae bacterium ESL0729]|nr:FtsW/RodA/SpoVE family cell cycle protein [Streptococcaceae bacterium ESL0729]